MNRCVNLDWLEVYCCETFPCDAAYFERSGYQVECRAYGTPMYAEMFTISEQGFPKFEVRRNPYSKKSEGGLFEDTACHIRLTNRFCYSVSPVDELRAFLLAHRYQFIGISRVDICLDFIKFDRGDDPAGFLKAFFRGRYAKINQCNISAHGKDLWNGQIWNSVKWGSPSSMISTKMYEKTLEMSETGGKKGYIVDQWKQAQMAEYQIVSFTDQKTQKTHFKNIVTAWLPEHVKAEQKINRNRAIPIGAAHPVKVWRVEFSIKTEGRHWVDLEKGRQLELNLTTIDHRTKLLFLFHSLAAHYFRFKVLEKKKDGSPQRKDRCPDKVLFVTSEKEAAYQPKALAMKRDATRMDRIILRRLYDITQDFEHSTPSERGSALILMQKISEEVLQKYAAQYARQDPRQDPPAKIGEDVLQKYAQDASPA